MRWALLLVPSIAAAEPSPVTITLGAGWRAAAGKTDLSKTVYAFGNFDASSQPNLGTAELSVLARVTSSFALGFHATTSSTLSGSGELLGNSQGTLDQFMLRPFTFGVAGQYSWRRFWVTPWVGGELLHVRYSIEKFENSHTTTTHRNEWDDNGTVIGVGAGVDLAGNAYLKATAFIEVETGIESSDTLPIYPFIDSSITWGFGLRY